MAGQGRAGHNNMTEQPSEGGQHGTRHLCANITAAPCADVLLLGQHMYMLGNDVSRRQALFAHALQLFCLAGEAQLELLQL